MQVAVKVLQRMDPKLMKASGSGGKRAQAGQAGQAGGIDQMVRELAKVGEPVIVWAPSDCPPRSMLVQACAEVASQRGTACSGLASAIPTVHLVALSNIAIRPQSKLSSPARSR